MKIKEKVRWLMNTADFKLETIYKGNTKRKINKSFNILDEKEYSYGFKELIQNDLQDFQNLYDFEIGKKDNSKLFNLIQLLSSRLGSGELFMIYIRKNCILVGGAIITLKDKRFTLAYKVSSMKVQKDEKLKIGLGNLIDYIFFDTFAKGQIDAELLSFGTDRNGYGILGAKPSLAIQKIRLGFLPNNFSENKDIELIPKDKELLFFHTLGKDNIYQEATLYISKETPDQEIISSYSSLMNSSIIFEIIKF